MNRETILACIRHHLQESLAECGDARPLGEIVPRVAADLREDAVDSEPVGVVPVAKVAAFVDGGLSEGESDRICQAALIDNSVLAELIAAVRAQRDTQSDLPPLSDALYDRLTRIVDSKYPPDSMHEARTEATATPALFESTVPVVASQKIPSATTSRRTQKRQPVQATLILIATVAAAISMVFLAVREFRSDDPRDKIAVQNPQDVEPREESPQSAPNPMEIAVAPVDASSDAPSHDVPLPPAEDDPPGERSPKLDAVATSEQPSDQSGIPAPNLANPAVDSPSSKQNPAELAIARPTVLGEMRWTEINGLLAQRSRQSSETSGGNSWQQIRDVGTVTAQRATDGVIAVKTMPLSRTQASFDSGGRLVLAADTEIKISTSSVGASARMEFAYGAIALMNFPQGTKILLDSVAGPPARLDWQSEGSAILQYAADGLQMHIHSGSIAVDDNVHEDESIAISPAGAVAAIEKPKRLPRWVDSSADTLPRNILWQIEPSGNLMLALNQGIRSFNENTISNRQRVTLVALARLQAASAGNHVFRLLNSPVATVRAAAMTRLLEIAPWDPRYAGLWRQSLRLTRDQARLVRLKNHFDLLRRGGKPNTTQIDQLLSGLDADEVAGRALSDFLLRKFLGGGPPFDPTWNPQNRARALGAWRQYTGRANRSRPAAAALQPTNRPNAP